MQARVKVVLVEDHAETREELQRALRAFSARIEVIAALPDAESFLRSSVKREVDVVLFDLNLPGMDGCTAIQTFLAERPLARAIALTLQDDEDTVLDAMRAGAVGYLVKDEPTERIVSAIEDAARGAHPLSSRIAGFLIQAVKQQPAELALTDREEEVARALAAGRSYAECAEQMGIAIGTVQSYVKNIYRKLDVGSKRALRMCLARSDDRR